MVAAIRSASCTGPDEPDAWSIGCVQSSGASAFTDSVSGQTVTSPGSLARIGS